MKKVFFLTIMLISISVSAQSKMEKSVKESTDEMTKVMSLNSEQSSKLYALQLESKKNIATFKKENEGNQSLIKTKVQEINKATNEQTKMIVGADNFKKWSAYKKENKSKKKKE